MIAFPQTSSATGLPGSAPAAVGRRGVQDSGPLLDQGDADFLDLLKQVSGRAWPAVQQTTAPPPITPGIVAPALGVPGEGAPAVDVPGGGIEPADRRLRARRSKEDDEQAVQTPPAVNPTELTATPSVQSALAPIAQAAPSAESATPLGAAPDAQVSATVPPGASPLSSVQPALPLPTSATAAASLTRVVAAPGSVGGDSVEPAPVSGLDSGSPIASAAPAPQRSAPIPPAPAVPSAAAPLAAGLHSVAAAIAAADQPVVLANAAPRVNETDAHAPIMDRAKAAAFAQNGPQPIAATPPAGTTNSGASRQDSGSGSGGQAATDSPAARPVTPPTPLSVPVVITTVALPAPTVVRVGATVTDRPAVVNDADLQNQVVQAVRLQWNDTSGTARIQLRPDYLGEMSVTIRVDQGSVTASLTSDTPAVREWIQAHTDVLRQGLADQGLRLDRVVIGEPSSSERQDREGRRQDQQSAEQQRKPAPRRRDEDEGTFEVNA